MVAVTVVELHSREVRGRRWDSCWLRTCHQLIENERAGELKLAVWECSVTEREKVDVQDCEERGSV